MSNNKHKLYCKLYCNPQVEEESCSRILFYFILFYIFGFGPKLGVSCVRSVYFV